MSSVESTAEAEIEDLSWVTDSLVQFLGGPVWNIPISSFIEKKSTIFDPEPDAEYTPEHYKVHKEYRNLVDSLLGGFVQEIEISPSQFQDAVATGCSEGSSSLARFQSGVLLEQIWAASDFTTFSQIMGLRNLELQLEALDSIKNKSKGEILDDPDRELSEEKLLRHVLRRSMEESSIIERMKKFNRLSLADTYDTETEETKPTQKKETKKISSASTHQKKDQSAKNVTVEQSTSSVKLTEEEIQKRKEYLVKQRDLLIKAKGKPITGKGNQSSSDTSANNKQDEDNEKALQVRRALVNRLKSEIINK